MSEDEIRELYPEFFVRSIKNYPKFEVRPDCAPWVECLQKHFDKAAFLKDIYSFMELAMKYRDSVRKATK